MNTRMLHAPYVNLIRRRIKLSLKRWISQRYYTSLKGRYLGRRGFVIGNGPSLSIADLAFLGNEITIASNKIYLAFEETKWRPTFHTMIDPLVIDKIGGIVRHHVPTTHVPEFYSDKVSGCKIITHRYRGEIASDPENKPHFGSDMRHGIYCGGTVTFDNLQLAVHLGLNPIYLIGCDHYYAGEIDVVPNSAIPVAGEKNHFHPDYRQAGELVNPAPIWLMTAAYKHAKAFADQNRIVMKNATLGGHLEVFERVEYKKLFK